MPLCMDFSHQLGHGVVSGHLVREGVPASNTKTQRKSMERMKNTIII